ncbi:hypothetical protein DMN91_000916 [Ooceraea biroi]|uniref:CHK kinase-like domain-containing protein n=1 Tax=Ooceraea biroi TaxID=2015173 RepID=A0A3L8E360_OOCBI|nr:hypothetical protein DMN91_000916 [Ooceraea biroi]
MSQKNRVDLSEINVKFTEQVLTDILCKAYNGTEIKLTDWNFGEGFAKGDSYLSTVNKGKVYGITQDDSKQQVRVNFVIKSIPKNVGRRKTFRSAEFFRNEIIFYTKASIQRISLYTTYSSQRVVPKFENFLAQRGQARLLCIPRYLASYMDGENDFIVLEDASCLGFGPASRQSCIDLAECAMTVKTLAHFHAISLAYRDQEKTEFAEIASCLEETYFTRQHWSWYEKLHERCVNIAKHALANEYPGSEAERRFNSYEFGALFHKTRELCERRDAPTSVVSEGDCWAPNFLIRDVGQDQKEVLMLDFQLARCVSPVCDLSFLLYSCTLKSFRDQHFDNILRLYHSELSDAIKLLGSDPERLYPLDLFMKEVKDHFIFGLVFSLEAIPFALLDPSQSFDLDVIIKGDEAMNVGDVMAVSNITTSSGRRRLADVIAHAVDNGYI